MLPSAPVSVVPDDACPLLLGLIAFASAPLAPVAPFALPEVVGLALAPEVSLGVPLIAPLGVSLVVSFDVPLPDAPDGLVVPPVDGRLSSTSPPDVPVVVTLGDALPVLGTQFAALVVPLAVPLAADADVSRLDGVVPVPSAPFVVFSPVKRSAVMPCWRPRGLVNGWGAPPPVLRCRDRLGAPHDGIRRGRGAGGAMRVPSPCRLRWTIETAHEPCSSDGCRWLAHRR